VDVQEIVYASRLACAHDPTLLRQLLQVLAQLLVPMVDQGAFGVVVSSAPIAHTFDELCGIVAAMVQDCVPHVSTAEVRDHMCQLLAVIQIHVQHQSNARKVRRAPRCCGG
jgi:hypothetical protein